MHERICELADGKPYRLKSCLSERLLKFTEANVGHRIPEDTETVNLTPLSSSFGAVLDAS